MRVYGFKSTHAATLTCHGGQDNKEVRSDVD